MQDYLPTTIADFLKKNVLFIFIGILGLIFLGYGLISLSKPEDKGEDVVFDTKSESSPSAQLQTPQIIQVDVEGGVVSPGVYSLPTDSRVQDALVKAGGLSTDANRDWVAHNMSLAQKVSDGAKIYIPIQGEDVVAIQTAGARVLGSSTQSDGMVHINTASESELDALPGIGPVTAAKIISNRPYTTVDELKSKKAVGSSVFEKIKDLVSL